MPHDAATLGFYDRRRVTRHQFSEFENNGLPEESPAYTILNSLRKEHRTELLNAGKGVCRIDIDGSTGTGFHLGNGWIMTNAHVICRGGDTPLAYRASFHFPELNVEACPRKVLVSHIEDPPETLPFDRSRKDLALIHVQEVAETPGITPLINVNQRPAERVYLIHYGDGTNEPETPQQFSMKDNMAAFLAKNTHGNKFIIHTAHQRKGSSGAPLIVIDKDHGLLVVGVHCGGFVGEILDSPGVALLFGGEDWLQKTINPVGNMERMYIDPQPVGVCQRLKKHLTDVGMRAIIPRSPPPGVHQDDFSPCIIWQPN